MSGIGSLNLSDFLKGLIVAVLSAVGTFVQQLIATSGTTLAVNWKLVGGVALAAALSYLAKNLGTDSAGKVAGITATAPPPPAPAPKG